MRLPIYLSLALGATIATVATLPLIEGDLCCNFYNFRLYYKVFLLSLSVVHDTLAHKVVYLQRRYIKLAMMIG